MIEDTKGFQHPVPHWVGLMVAVVLFGSLMLFGGYWAWARYTEPGSGELVEVPAIPQARVSINTPAPQQPGVQRATGANGQVTFTVRSTDAVLTVVKSTAQPNWAYTFGYNKSDLMTADQTAIATARFRLMSDTAFAKSLKVTDDQLTKLKATPAVTTMIVSDADQALVKAAFVKYEAQNNSANEQALVKALSDVANRSLAPTRTAIAQKVQQIQAILTAEQIKPFKTP